MKSEKTERMKGSKLLPQPYNNLKLLLTTIKSKKKDRMEKMKLMLRMMEEMKMERMNMEKRRMKTTAV